MWFQNKMLTILQDFSDDTDLEDTPPQVEEELSVRKLKENVRRFKSGSEPIMLYFKVLSALLSWRSPASTFLAFLLYMFAIYSGWFLPVFFGLILWHFSKTYLISRGWNIEFSLLPYHTIEKSSEEDKTLGMSDKFQLVLQVAKKAQNFLGEAADSLEKLQNLFAWTDVEITRSLYKNVLTVFILSLFLPASTLLTYAGFFIGFKMFIIKHLFQRYPRLKQKYDTVQNMWKKLPTNEEKIQRQIVAQRKQVNLSTRLITLFAN
ncbi:GRAM domain-containing protein 4-like [Anneissia japonica]|uniref:GRAM domain-containing protein 4-like n=1 Tax=Anneissia japonica TaxID=1529436 RepID=UPI0014257F1D|nr:GRAM domain-containing protein 4-like [Anneissia japonica]